MTKIAAIQQKTKQQSLQKIEQHDRYSFDSLSFLYYTFLILANSNITTKIYGVKTENGKRF